MTYILSCGIHEADYNYDQDEIQSFIQHIFPMELSEQKRLSPIFQNTQIERRQLAFPLEWYQNQHSLEEVNRLYCERALHYSKQAVSNCLNNHLFLQQEIEASAVDHIIFISSTGISTPTIDAYLIDELNFNEHVKRTPIFGLGCAGGTSGISKAFDYLRGAPQSNVLVVCVELCSLTFQHKDTSISNFVGSALFGDGASAVFLVGKESSLLHPRNNSLPKVTSTSTKTKPNSQSVMGWKVVNTGFEVIFKKNIPKLVHSFWKSHIEECLIENKISVSELPFIIAHPGGTKVIDAYMETLEVPGEMFKYSKQILRQHGNMSSPTVHYVLYEAMRNFPSKGSRSFMTSLGPGFTSEIVGLEWV
ncbi:type III polyketide synthase [Halobacillus seohaensis]|uniref:Type III polyketide synthase n=1 Tax=Halobacillus seohaensis TaxID=447421 RepID=A0ABW2EE34_9BACI